MPQGRIRGGIGGIKGNARAYLSMSGAAAIPQITPVFWFYANDLEFTLRQI